MLKRQLDDHHAVSLQFYKRTGRYISKHLSTMRFLLQIGFYFFLKVLPGLLFPGMETYRLPYIQAKKIVASVTWNMFK